MQSTVLSAAGCCALVFALAEPALAQTQAHWNFDSGTLGASFSITPAADLSGNYQAINGYDSILGPTYSDDTSSGSGLSCRVANQDGYTTEPSINNWSPLRWTIEASVKMERIDGWNTIIGRDGSSWPTIPKSDFYFQNNGDDDRFRLDFATVDGSRYILDSDFVPSTGAWYHVALVCDGAQVSMYIDRNDGGGYQLAASSPLPPDNDAGNALAASGDNWTFGRGWYAGKHVDHLTGNIDDVRFTNGALAPAQFLHAPAVKTSLDVARSGQDVSLAWKLPSGTVRKVEIYRHDRVEPAGRTLIATINSATEVYLERVPSKEATYWYWLAMTMADGKTETVGPVSTKASEVWVP